MEQRNTAGANEKPQKNTHQNHHETVIKKQSKNQTPRLKNRATKAPKHRPNHHEEVRSNTSTPTTGEEARAIAAQNRNKTPEEKQPRVEAN
jgi:hypothetical protein